MRLRILLLAAACAAIASPGLALKITNLDTVPHRISFTSAGAAHEAAIAPNETVRYESMPNGRLSLLSSPNPRTGGTVNADGLLKGIIGNGRDQQIPVDIADEYVIWRGGDLQLQRRTKRYGRD